MKKLIGLFVLSCVALGCSNASNLADLNIVGSLIPDNIDLKIAKYHSSPSSDTQPVANIKAEFDKNFPNATDIEWKVSNGIYEIDFEIGRVDYEAWYDSDANLLMYKHDIANSQVSQPVLNAIKTDYQGYVLDESEKVYRNDMIGFYLELKRSGHETHALYNENGTFVSKNLWRDNTTDTNGNNVSTTPPQTTNGTISDSEIDALLLAYKRGRDIDIRAKNVPNPIMTAFKSKFATARDVEWDYVGNVYNVDFEIGTTDYEAWYRNDGAILMYTKEIRFRDAPAVVQNAVSSKYSEYKIDESYYFEKGAVKGYIFELENRRTDAELKVMYNESGTFITQMHD